MSDPHVLRFDPSKSGALQTFNAIAVTASLWRFEVFARFGSSTPFHAVIHAHEPVHGGARRKDPEGVPAMLMSRIDESTWLIEPTRIHRDAPKVALQLSGWVPSKDAA